MKTILIADDDPKTVAVVGRNLRQAGYRVVSAVSGEDALYKAKRLAPDLILMDFLLPGIDGYEAIHLLRQAPETVQIPVLILSVIARDCLPPARMLHAAAEHLTKPAPMGLLLDRVAKHIDRSRRQ